MINLASQARTTTIRRCEIKLKASDIRDLVRKQMATEGLDPAGLPDHAEVTVMVPGGGDWSNTALDIDEHNVFVRWTEEETSDY